MDKIQELMIAFFVSITGVFAFLAKRLFASVDNANKRIDKLESKIVDRQFLESQIDPIRSELYRSPCSNDTNRFSFAIDFYIYS